MPILDTKQYFYVKVPHEILSAKVITAIPTEVSPTATISDSYLYL